MKRFNFYQNCNQNILKKLVLCGALMLPTAATLTGCSDETKEVEETTEMELSTKDFASYISEEHILQMVTFLAKDESKWDYKLGYLVLENNCAMLVEAFTNQKYNLTYMANTSNFVIGIGEAANFFDTQALFNNGITTEQLNQLKVNQIIRGYYDNVYVSYNEGSKEGLDSYSKSLANEPSNVIEKTTYSRAKQK